MQLTVCDPAMGSGHFLIEVVEYMHRRIGALTDDLEESQQEHIQKTYNKSHIASQCVYGVDINYLAVELAKVVMWIKTFDPEIPLQFLDANLKR
jgi:type II restriction/modification system DNA methylase subunit YeeA